jgi:prolipoprotein diacylglyceryl transferase
VWHLGPIPIRAYALCIVAGIFVALWLTGRRWRARGGAENDVWDVAGWAIVFGILGGRLYHVITDPELYFTKGAHPIDALKIWDGGLGIWGAIALGGVGAWIGCRRKGIRLTAFADAAAPGIVAAQGIGRWGNWFNNELYGGPTSLPWRLQIHDIDVVTGHTQPCGFGQIGQTVCGYYQPTFLYESIWDVSTAVILILLDRRYKLGHGRVFALYLVIYGLGRSWIEALRIDPAHHFFGLRLNDWTSIIIVLAGVVGYVVSARRHPAREEDLLRAGVATVPADSATVDLDDAAVGDAAAAEVTVGSDADRDAPPGGSGGSGRSGSQEGTGT